MDQDHTPETGPLVLIEPNLYSGQYEHPPSRVLVNQGMLYGYAAMRGNLDKGRLVSDPTSDPLHTSLYLNPTVPIHAQFEMPFDIPLWQRTNDPLGDQEMARGSQFYCDVSSLIYKEKPHPQSPAPPGYARTENLSYEDYQSQNPRQKNRNHYSGDEGWGNYGYLSVNGHWVDPDSIKEVSEAVNDNTSNSYAPDLPVGTTPLRNLTDEQLYQEFMEEANFGQDGDNEGDPRAMHITPAVFARWAAGATRGDSYAQDNFEPQGLLFTQRPCHERLPRSSVVRDMRQYDIETGSVFSGEYSPERSPSLALSPRGVDMMQIPTNFCYMDPKAGADLNRAAYGDPDDQARVNDWLSSSDISSPLVDAFKEDNIIKYLGYGESPSAGREKWEAYTSGIEDLQAEYLRSILKSNEKNALRNNAAEAHIRTYKEAYFMEEHLKKRDNKLGSTPPAPRVPVSKLATRLTPQKTQFRPQSRRELAQTTPTTGPHRSKHMQGASQPNDTAKSSRTTHTRHQSIPPLQDEISQIESSYPFVPGQLRRKLRFERHFFELQEQQRININRMKAAAEYLGEEVEDIVEAAHDLNLIHGKYRDDLGIQSVSEIPNLFPRRKKTPATDKGQDDGGDKEGAGDVGQTREVSQR